MPTVFAFTYHDPEGRLVPQMRRTLPLLKEICPQILVNATSVASPSGLSTFREAGAIIRQNHPEEDVDPPRIGRSRRRLLEMALETQAGWVFYLDGDAALHWADTEPDELARVSEQIRQADFTVLGRTPESFATYPRFQIDTERVANHIFGLVSGQVWDITAGARGVSRRAAEAITTHSKDDALSTDVSWPLLLDAMGGFKLAYLENKGLSYETGDRYPVEVAELGGLEAWKAQLDADPRRWFHRLKLALQEAEAALPYHKEHTQGPLGPFSTQRD